MSGNLLAALFLIKKRTRLTLIMRLRLSSATIWTFESSSLQSCSKDWIEWVRSEAILGEALKLVLHKVSAIDTHDAIFSLRLKINKFKIIILSKLTKKQKKDSKNIFKECTNISLCANKHDIHMRVLQNFS